ncbi:MAG: hypothetical protein FWC22_07890 [Treponema sp.]|nr:hypothetical protein [Treponema sp.]
MFLKLEIPPVWAVYILPAGSVSEGYENAKECVMKNTIRVIGIIVLAAVIGFTMVACGGGGGKPNGTYYNEQYKSSYTFSGDKLTMDVSGYTFEFTFSVKDGKLITSSDLGIAEINYTLKGKELTIFNDDGSSFTLIKQ